uniref:uncharacterized protein LOC120340026 n=1 Tax=Styela clava TaxID=7725 RepID=UPI00193A75E0|nr:uncharacterized protein LOC120340026 [Styela clava]
MEFHLILNLHLTDGYRPPESFVPGFPTSQKTDIYLLAVIVYYVGKHPFGDERDLWNHFMKNHKNLNLDGLLVPDAEIAKDLLEWMLQFVPRKRPMISEVLSHQYMAPSNVKGLLFRDLQKEPAHGGFRTILHDELLLPHFDNGTFKSDLSKKTKKKIHSSQVATSLSKLVNNFHFAKYLEAEKEISNAALTSKDRRLLTDDIWWFKDKLIYEEFNVTVYEGQLKPPTSVTEHLSIWLCSSWNEDFLHKIEVFRRLPPHPNIISVFASGWLKEMNRYFIATERCQIQTLSKYYEERKQNKIHFDPRLALVHAKQLVSGLQHLHKHHIAHGELKSDIRFSLDMQNVKISFHTLYTIFFSSTVSFEDDIFFGVESYLNYGLIDMI